MDLYGLLKEFGPAGAVILVVVLFLRHLSSMRSAFTTVITNHLEHTRDDHSQFVGVLDGLKGAISELGLTIKLLRKEND